MKGRESELRNERFSMERELRLLLLLSFILRLLGFGLRVFFEESFLCFRFVSFVSFLGRRRIGRSRRIGHRRHIEIERMWVRKE